MKRYLFTLQTKNRVGLLQFISETITRLKGSWLDSTVKTFQDKVAIIAELDLEESKLNQFLIVLNQLDNVQITYSTLSVSSVKKFKQEFYFTAYDRKGLIYEVASGFADIGVDIEEFHTEYEVDRLTSTPLIHASFLLSFDDTSQEYEIIDALNNVSYG